MESEKTSDSSVSTEKETPKQPNSYSFNPRYITEQGIIEVDRNPYYCFSAEKLKAMRK